MKLQLFFVAALLTVPLLGCVDRLPDDLPKRYPCNIKIVAKDGTPVAEASVVATSPDSKWASIGLTGPDGIAVMKTNGTYLGVPAGTYKIVVTKYDVIDRGESVDPIEKPVFDQSFASEATTPLELTVETRTNAVTFEVW